MISRSPQSTFNDLSTERFYDPGSAVDVYGVTATATVSVPAPAGHRLRPGRRTAAAGRAGGLLRTQTWAGCAWKSRMLSVDIPIVGVPRPATAGT